MKHFNAENVTVSFIMDAVSSRAIEFNFAYHSKHEVINGKTAQRFHITFQMYLKKIKITVHETIDSEKTTKNQINEVRGRDGSQRKLNEESMAQKVK